MNKTKTIQNTTKFLIISAIFSIFLLSFASYSQAIAPAFTKLQAVSTSAPTALALDARENLYVVSSTQNSLNIYNHNGAYLTSLLTLNKPISVAVDAGGRIFIGNAGANNVEVYDGNLNFLFKLGSGNGEFVTPAAITTDNAGNIYVADLKSNIIKIYNPDGSYKSSFGSTGSGDGQFQSPTSIAINEAAGEIIVSDLKVITTTQGITESVRIQIFDMNGVFKRTFGAYGQGEGYLIRTMGVDVDGAGRIYVTDSYQNIAQVYNSNGTYLGSIYDEISPMRTPMGIAIGKSNRLFIASLNASRVDVFGVDSYTVMGVSPLTLSFEGQQGGDPQAQNVEISNTGTGTLNWSASVSDSWITLSQTSGSTPPAQLSILNVGINLAGLLAGTYSGTVTVTAESGVTEVVSVSLTVTAPPAVLSVNPSSLDYTSLNGLVPSAQTLTIENTGGGTLDWNATSNSSWITLNKYSGAAPDTITVSVDPAGLSAGIYVGTITVTADSATGSPANIIVTLNVIAYGTINVTTNRTTATFTISGPASYSGSGTSMTATDAPPGTYAIIYGDVLGYITPASQTQTLTGGGSISFTGTYVKKTVVKKNIIAGAGPGSTNPATVNVVYSDGAPTGVQFIANTYKYGVNVASGDIDGDGIFEIITGAGPGPQNPGEVNIFDRTGSKIVGFTVGYNGARATYNYGINVASGDFDGDGQYEVITGAGAGPANPSYVKIYAYDPAIQQMVDSGIDLLAYDTLFGVEVAAGDVDDDGVAELITAPGAGNTNTGIIRIWDIDTSMGVGQWSATLTKEFTAESYYKYSVNITSADVNGDGYDEIITGAGPDRASRDTIKVFDRNGTQLSQFTANLSRAYGTTIDSGDTNGDGIAEIVAGAGPYAGNRAFVRILNASSGAVITTFKPLNTLYGVNVAAGDLGY
ncbi:MAG: hypothetical protein HZA10_11445 [Nitrospirae bacterium]|nr:hypothetical protein [Nitrospirota bacterium]